VRCAATLDLAVARRLVEADDTEKGRDILERINAILTAMARKLKDS